MTLKVFFVVLLAAACSACLALTGKDIKGVYVTGWTPGAFTKAEIDATLDGAKEMGATDIFLQVRKYDDALYNSALVKKVANVAPGFDPARHFVFLRYLDSGEQALVFCNFSDAEAAVSIRLAPEFGGGTVSLQAAPWDFQIRHTGRG